ncbi:metal-dependent hydrolase [Methanosarcina sp. 2.H.A.1B.4]|uniref:metal-dependent hydrolase n=1 Tax=Methanosarcina sp. 2.H.A.1B.4 TaxID=1483600 RepID=UPI0006228B4A|nr:metal-dependent hydrolase [Methanosarcina sp. 2.H.A.1B.4]KKG11178.1 hypothetical protein EO92_17875 [Methanosarcina sp. 2.H.A.1B.4]
MPYPVVHVLFFLFCIGAVAIYAITKALSRGELSFRDSRKLLLLMFVGGLCTMFPDLIVVYNLLINGTLQHCWVGPIPTHSLLFSSTAILFGGIIGYAAYRELNKAVYMAIFAESAFLTHLLLDDIAEAYCPYLYPLYNEPTSVFSLMNAEFTGAGLFHYLIASFASVFFIFIVILMALFALSRFGFEFSYRAEK